MIIDDGTRSIDALPSVLKAAGVGPHQISRPSFGPLASLVSEKGGRRKV